MDQNMRVNGKKIALKDKAHTLGQIQENILALGSTIILTFYKKLIKIEGMDKEVTHGQMAENTKELMKMIRNTDLVCILGLMEGNMRDIGLMKTTWQWSVYIGRGSKKRNLGRGKENKMGGR